MSADGVKMTTEYICTDFASEITVNNEMLRVARNCII